ncbi:hypothetical protein CDAR_402961 [Caerostris darwini]|uniref:Uncharacterized protein n=1 Tax=Caerostris darwini TaxID=1538125 RepID=A0AAV4WZM0_9ARAC|nr:hypothetical protein CDAR_402961 [Caerostris darwini]
MPRPSLPPTACTGPESPLNMGPMALADKDISLSGRGGNPIRVLNSHQSSACRKGNIQRYVRLSETVKSEQLKRFLCAFQIFASSREDDSNFVNRNSANPRIKTHCAKPAEREHGGTDNGLSVRPPLKEPLSAKQMLHCP